MIELANAKSKLKKWQRVFVNRSLNLGYIRAIGFDMDYTLAIYNREEFEGLAFRKTLEKFIESGYPEELLQIKFNPNFVIRGLLVDRSRGNLLKVDAHKYVKIAFHGHRKLSKDERHKLYNAESYKAGDFLSIDTFFALSEVQLFTEIVDYMNKNPGKIQKSFEDVYKDLRQFIDACHRDGSIKNIIIKNPERYLNKDKFLAEALVRLIEAGKTLFLLTNSDWSYSDTIMSFILESTHGDVSHWRDYFDYIIVSARKPEFFTGNQPFYEVDTESGMLRQSHHNGILNPNRIYHGGNAQLFQKLIKVKGDSILYVGDHIYGDIIRSKDLFNWRTMLVVPELDLELPKLEDQKNSLDFIREKLSEREILDEELQRLRSIMTANDKQKKLAFSSGNIKKIQNIERDRDKNRERLSHLEQKLHDLDKNIKELIKDHEAHIHPVWGELMKVGLEKSRFAQQVEEYACIYTSRASNLRFYSPFKRFASTHDLLPHDI